MGCRRGATNLATFLPQKPFLAQGKPGTVQWRPPPGRTTEGMERAPNNSQFHNRLGQHWVAKPDRSAAMPFQWLQDSAR